MGDVSSAVPRDVPLEYVEGRSSEPAWISRERVDRGVPSPRTEPGWATIESDAGDDLCL